MLPVKDFPGYFVDRSGRIYSNKRGYVKLRKTRLDESGHVTITLRRDSSYHTRGVHVLMMTTFVGPCPEGMECRHLDGNPENNKLTNLKWCTRSENVKDAIKHGTHSSFPKKLSGIEIKTIMRMAETKLFKHYELASLFGVSGAYISMIVNKKRRDDNAIFGR